MPERKLYRKRPKFNVTAVQVDLDLQCFQYKKWGNIQTCNSGDWLVNNGGDVYTVKKDVFTNTYQKISPGVFEKFAEIWAEEATEDGSIKTHEGFTNYKAGDYLVFDRKTGGDGYAINRHNFERMYEEVDRETKLSPKQQAYVDDRLASVIDQYKIRAAINRRNYHFWQSIAVISAALVPVFSGFMELSSAIQWIVALLGGASAVVAGMLSLFKFQENWMRLKSTYLDLESHLAQFSVKAGIYGEAKNAFHLLVDNCENILYAERGQWAEKYQHEQMEEE